MTMPGRLKRRVETRLIQWRLRWDGAWGEERGGGRFTDEAFMIGGGALLAGVIYVAVKSFIDGKLALLGG